MDETALVASSGLACSPNIGLLLSTGIIFFSFSPVAPMTGQPPDEAAAGGWNAAGVGVEGVEVEAPPPLAALLKFRAFFTNSRCRRAASSTSTSADDDADGSRESKTPVADSMRRKLTEQLEPVHLKIVDESGKHAGHAGRMGVAPGTGETHFVIEVTSEKFAGLTSLKRHRLVYGIVDDEVSNGPVHALSLVTKTPDE